MMTVIPISAAAASVLHPSIVALSQCCDRFAFVIDSLPHFLQTKWSPPNIKARPRQRRPWGRPRRRSAPWGRSTSPTRRWGPRRIKRTSILTTGSAMRRCLRLWREEQQQRLEHLYKFKRPRIRISTSITTSTPPTEATLRRRNSKKSTWRRLTAPKRPMPLPRRLLVRRRRPKRRLLRGGPSRPTICSIPYLRTSRNNNNSINNKGRF